MAFQLGTTLRNTRVSQVLTVVGSSGATMKIFSGGEPANCAAPDPVGVLCTISLPNLWLGSASGGAVSMAGTWSGAASATGTAQCFRIYDSGGVVCHLQGNLTATGGGGDGTLDNIAITSGQTVNVTSFTLTDGGA